MAEALINHLGAGEYKAFSAGSKPTGDVHPLALKTLAANEVSLKNPRSKSWDEFTDTKIDIVITVCDNAAGESCPVFPGTPLKAHWGLPDPAAATGTDAQIETEFNRVFSMLRERVEAFLSLPLDSLSKDEQEAELKKIGTI